MIPRWSRVIAYVMSIPFRLIHTFMGLIVAPMDIIEAGDVRVGLQLLKSVWTEPIDLSVGD